MRKNIKALNGLVCVELRGGEGERLLNACAEAALPLGNVSCEDSFSLRAWLPESELPRLEKIAALCRTETRIVTRKGGEARLVGARLRLCLFAAVCALLLTLSSLFIWDIEVEGNQKLSKSEILRLLADCGVSEGCFWPAADAERVRSAMLLRCEDLAWMTLNVRGSRATVLVLEREEKPKIYDERAAADLVAARDGVVRNLSVKNGRALVTVGELVTAGQTLVSGTMDSPTGESRRVRAEGSVTAETWPERTVFLSPGAREKERISGLRVILGLRFGKNRIDLVTNSRKELDECDRIVKEYTLGIGGLFRFPLGMSVEIYRPYRARGEAAADLPGAEARALAALEEEIDGKILSCDFEERDGRIALRAHCMENIALTEEKENP
jgi:similar to stage IV sporulation protein